jgi:hypothetical protein
MWIENGLTLDMSGHPNQGKLTLFCFVVKVWESKAGVRSFFC